MKRSTVSAAPLIFVLLAVAWVAAPGAEAQTVYGISALSYNPETTIMDGYSVTELDYLACYYYAPYVQGYLYQDVLQVDSGADLGPVCTAEVDTSTFVSPGHTYTELSDHYIVAFYYYAGLGYYDPYGFGFYGGEYGSDQNFYGCNCPEYYYAEYIYLGSTAVTYTPCNKTPTLTVSPTQVTRGGTATFTAGNLCPDAVISNWKFTDGTNTVMRTNQPGKATWQGVMVTSGSASVTVKQNNHTYNPPPASITVNKRTSGFKFTAVPASKQDPGYDCKEQGKLDIPPPVNNSALGLSCLLQRASFQQFTLGDNGPNSGYTYVTSASDKNDPKSPDSPNTLFAYAISTDLQPTKDFYKAQCGDYDPVTDTGLIGSAQLLSNTTNHESGMAVSHYKNYVTAQDDPANNIGVGYELVVAGPAENFANKVSMEINTRRTTIDNARVVEWCPGRCMGKVNCDDSCTWRGNINYTPYQPCRPTGLTATANSSTKVTLGWNDNSTNEDGFLIERKSNGAFQQIASVNHDVVTYPDTTVVASTDYTYQVRAYAGTKFSAYSNQVTVHTPASGSGGAPASPASATAAAASSTQITIGWTDTSTNEDGFKIERKTGAGSFAQIATTGPNVVTYADATVAPATTYTYRVKAFNVSGDSGYSNEISATTPTAPPNVPAAPSGLSATAAGPTQANLAWADNSTNEDGFKIERRTASGSYAQIAVVGANVATYADSGLTASTAYVYRVKAYNGAGDSAYSNEASVSTAAPNVPAAPSNLNASSPSTSEIDLSWSDNSSNELGFKIERQGNGVPYAQIATVGANVIFYADTAVATGAYYTYRVRAYNAAGDSAYSNESSALVQYPQVPSPPSSLTATAVSSTEIDLAWNDSSYNELGFHVWRATGNGASSQIATIYANVTHYADTGVAPFTTYTYRVSAYNENGESLYANPATATTPSLPGAGPTVPCCLQANAGSSGNGYAYVSLIWVDRSSDETGFVVERKDANSSTWYTVAYLPADSTSLGDSTVALSTTYTYRVGAYNSTGKNYTAEVQVTTPDG